eukprot:CAMPEP_0113625852 /NCGR_PEP_ID=MMETSP0017_2-20120614/13358_1 /TAXON_ID=2856 /ORGANISM="Cylindrotheca closterium" /LENGTH=130 /DNA_ID=CAMNT_0000535989 /DNA_START=51 /DNA_END=443 /DNA_ORIENTATION=- /assembly_acc=CAM_ASM_000147
MALDNYFSELMAIKGMENAQLVRDDARIAQNPKLTRPKRRSLIRHPTFRPNGRMGTSPPPNRPSRKRSDEDLKSASSRLASTRCSKIEETKNSLELFYSEVAPNRTPKSPTKDNSDSEFESMESIESVEE